MRYEVRQMPKGAGGRFYVHDTVTHLDVCRQWPQARIPRTWATEAAAKKMAAKFERENDDGPLMMPKGGPPPGAFKSYADRLNADAQEFVRKLRKDR